jgi:hypothetical protein
MGLGWNNIQTLEEMLKKFLNKSQHYSQALDARE